MSIKGLFHLTLYQFLIVANHPLNLMAINHLNHPHHYENLHNDVDD